MLDPCRVDNLQIDDIPFFCYGQKQPVHILLIEEEIDGIESDHCVEEADSFFEEHGNDLCPAVDGACSQLLQLDDIGFFDGILHYPGKTGDGDDTQTEESYQ